MKRLATLALLVLSVFTIGKIPDPSWITERPICVDSQYSHVCGPRANDLLGT